METFTAKTAAARTMKNQQGQARLVPAGTPCTVTDRRRDGKGYTIKAKINGETVTLHNQSANTFK